MCVYMHAHLTRVLKNDAVSNVKATCKESGMGNALKQLDLGVEMIVERAI